MELWEQWILSVLPWAKMALYNLKNSPMNNLSLLQTFWKFILLPFQGPTSLGPILPNSVGIGRCHVFLLNGNCVFSLRITSLNRTLFLCLASQEGNLMLCLAGNSSKWRKKRGFFKARKYIRLLKDHRREQTVPIARKNLSINCCLTSNYLI